MHGSTGGGWKRNAKTVSPRQPPTLHTVASDGGINVETVPQLKVAS